MCNYRNIFHSKCVTRNLFHTFLQVYLYVFISLFIYVVLSVFISLISDTYETLHVSLLVLECVHHCGVLSSNSVLLPLLLPPTPSFLPLPPPPSSFFLPSLLPSFMKRPTLLLPFLLTHCTGTMVCEVKRSSPRLCIWTAGPCARGSGQGLQWRRRLG